MIVLLTSDEEYKLRISLRMYLPIKKFSLVSFLFLHLRAKHPLHKPVINELYIPSDSLLNKRSGDRIPVGARFCGLFPTRPGTYPVRYTMGTGSFSLVKRLERGINPPTHLASLCAFIAGCRVNSTSIYLMYPLRVSN